MKKIAIIAITALALLFPEPAGAAVKAGQICKKVNQSATSNGKKFTCVKSGKKLIWRASAVPQPASTPMASATPSPEPIKTEQRPLEITSSSAAKIGTGCSFSGTHVGLLEGPAQCKEANGQKIWTLIAKENDSVASRAYRYVLEKYLAAPEGNLAIDVRMDPNTPEWGKKIEKGLFAGARFWGTSPSGSAPVPTLISADLKWFLSRYPLKISTSDKKILAEYFLGTCWNKVIKRSLFEGMIYGNVSINSQEDLIYSFEILMKAKNILEKLLKYLRIV